MDRFLIDRIERLAGNVEKLRLSEYLQYVSDTRRLIWVNFISGVARGFGFAVGFSLLGALFIVLLQRMAVDSLPVIGEFLAEVIRIVEKNL
ncbi:MAG TPA: hypothetical protein IAB73_10190 [Candidatus Onthenecus intestinigallinarum]|uniref:Uncharacterized protein n=1 Tax=Candidatus Onthenecus intestinigallinarum TaxID=2840875 RepID=A0A9D1CRE0_9FIRM|nr:hypothetical protein [Candidatus Onthenecus intestinigallinarum]